MHDVAETLTEPTVGEVERAPYSDDAGGVDDDDGDDQQGGQAGGPSSGQRPVVVAQEQLQARFGDVAEHQEAADARMLRLLGRFFFAGGHDGGCWIG